MGLNVLLVHGSSFRESLCSINTFILLCKVIKNYFQIYLYVFFNSGLEGATSYTVYQKVGKIS